MKILPTELPGVVVLEPRRFEDARGHFAAVFSAEGFAAAGDGHHQADDADHERPEHAQQRGDEPSER